MSLTKKEQYDLTKEMLFAKYDGKCSFCGEGLGNIWHIWDIEPSKSIIDSSGEFKVGNENYDNKLPCCVSCSSTRSHYSDKNNKIGIEKFRECLMHEHEYLKGNTYYRKMLKYNLIKETRNEIVFYFEKQK